MHREYKCQNISTDWVSFRKKDNSVYVRIHEYIKGVGVKLNEEQIHNLYELLGAVVGCAPKAECQWRDIC